MSTIESHMTLSESQSVLGTRAVDDGALASNESDRYRTGWQDAIDHRLIEWGRDPSVLEDDGLEPPTHTALSTAVDLAIRFRDEANAAPSRVVPSGDGGVVFERHQGKILETLEVSGDGGIEYAQYLDSRLVRRQRVS